MSVEYKNMLDYKKLIDYGRYCADKLLLGEDVDLDAMNFYERKSFTRNLSDNPLVLEAAAGYIVDEELRFNPFSENKVLDSELDAPLYPFPKIDERIGEYSVKLFKKYNASNQHFNKRTARAIFNKHPDLLDSIVEKLALKDLFRFDAESVKVGIKLLIERFGEKKVYDFMPAEYYPYFVEAKPNKNTPFLPKKGKLFIFDPALGYENLCKRYDMAKSKETQLLSANLEEFSKSEQGVARLNKLVEFAINALGKTTGIRYLCDYFYYIEVLNHKEYESFMFAYREYIHNTHPILWSYGGLYSNKHIKMAIFNKENICELPMGSRLIRRPLRGDTRYLDTLVADGINTPFFRASIPCKHYFKDVWEKFTAYYITRLSREYADLGSYGAFPCQTLEGLTIAEAKDLAPYLIDEDTIDELAEEFMKLGSHKDKSIF